MKKILYLVIIMALSGLFIALSLPYILHPSIYTPYNDTSTLYHRNPTIFTEYSSIRSEEIIIRMQELLDAPPSIVQNIKAKNFDQAMWEFDRYQEKSRDFNDTVFNLNLDTSLIGDFNRENQKILSALEEMMSDDQFEEIDLVLNKRNDILEISNQLHLNITHMREESGILKEILDEDLKNQEQQNLPQTGINPPTNLLFNTSFSKRYKGSLSRYPPFFLTISPSSGKYGESLIIDGTYFELPVSEMTLVIDDSDWKTIQLNKSGLFSIPLQIGKISSGEHFIFAYNGEFYSNLVNFSVIPVETSLNLDIYPGIRKYEVACLGRLHAGGIPVKDAPIKVMVDGIPALVMITNQSGFFNSQVELPKGNHTIQAIFDDTAAYPLNYSKSGIKTIDVEQSTSLPLIIVVGAISVLIVIGGVYYIRLNVKKPVSTIMDISHTDKAMLQTEEDTSIHSILTNFRRGYEYLFEKGKKWYIRLIKKEEDSSIIQLSEIIEPLHETAKHPSEIATINDTIIQYNSLLHSGQWSGAAFLLYEYLVNRLIPFHRVENISTVTPREFVTLLSDASFEVSFRSFIRRYEEIRYGGWPLKNDDILLTYWKEVLSKVSESDKDALEN